MEHYRDYGWLHIPWQGITVDRTCYTWITVELLHRKSTCFTSEYYRQFQTATYACCKMLTCIHYYFGPRDFYSFVLITIGFYLINANWLVSANIKLFQLITAGAAIKRIDMNCEIMRQWRPGIFFFFLCKIITLHVYLF